MRKQSKSLLPFCLCILGVFFLFSGLSSQQTAAEMFEKALYLEEAQGDLQKAIGVYEEILTQHPDDRAVAAKAQLHIGLCYEKLGLKEAEIAFQKVISDFPEQAEAVKLARGKLSLLSGVRAALEKGTGELRIRKVWDNAIDSFFMGAISPDGTYLTYVDWQNFANLGVRDLTKGENRILTDIRTWDNGEMCYGSVFSPDGSKIAYSFQTKDMLNQLRIVNLDGSSTRILHDGKDVSFQSPIGWTANAKQILTVFYGKDNKSRIVFVSTDDGSVKEVTVLPIDFRGRTRLSLSPDGRYIAYNNPPQEGSSNGDIFLLSTDGGREAALVEHPADDIILGWSPDGEHVIFVSDRTGSLGTWAVRVSDGKPQGMPELVRGDMGNLLPLGMTRDGKLYYGTYTGWSDIFVAPIDAATGQVTSQPEKAVRKYETFNSAPDWSPDGQFLVCRTSRGWMPSAGKNPALLIRSMQTGELRELNPKRTGGLNFHYLRWSPDGRTVLGIGRDESGKYGALLSIDVQAGETKVIARSDQDDPIFAPNWTPDGKSIYFLRSGKEFRRIIKFELETGVEKEIFRSPQSPGTYWLMLSPDGQELAVAAENKIRILSAYGAESRELMEAKNLTTIAWMGSGKSILYGKLQEGSQDVADLWCVPVTGGEPQKTGLTMSRLMHLRVSPDGKSVAFTASEQPQKSEVWVMENFLPVEKK